MLSPIFAVQRCSKRLFELGIFLWVPNYAYSYRIVTTDRIYRADWRPFWETTVHEGEVPDPNLFNHVRTSLNPDLLGS